MSDYYAQEIKSRVTFPELLQRYGFQTRRGNRIPCPIHNGRDNNFSYDEKRCKCFVCGFGGDVITFTEKYFGLSFSDSVAKLNEDFSLGLPIGKKPTLQQKRAIEAAQAERDRQQDERKRLENEYHAALDEYCRLDRNRVKYAPKSPEEELHPLFVEALHGMDAAERRLYLAEAKL